MPMMTAPIIARVIFSGTLICDKISISFFPSVLAVSWLDFKSLLVSYLGPHILAGGELRLGFWSVQPFGIFASSSMICDSLVVVLYICIVDLIYRYAQRARMMV